MFTANGKQTMRKYDNYDIIESRNMQISNIMDIMNKHKIKIIKETIYLLSYINYQLNQHG